MNLGNDSLMLGRGVAHFPGIYKHLNSLESEEVKTAESKEKIESRVESMNKAHPGARPLLGAEEVFFKSQYW